ncbi:MAG: CAP domain-containing protein [Actinomycetota bacterium]|nr:CAP domain-containing protein [Actinomycetota bacterium]
MAYAKQAGVVVVAVVLAVAAAVGLSAVNPSPAEAALVSVKTCGGDTIDLDSIEKRTLDLHNETRVANGLPAFCVQPKLTNAARAHSQEMLDKDYFSHNSYDGETFGARLKRFGYTSSGYSYYTVGENIAWGSGSYGSPDAIFKGWMNSTGHKANILNKNFREIGIGARTGTYKTYAGATIYTVDFGTRR